MLDQDTQLLLLVGGAAFLFIVAVALLLLPNEDEKDKRVKNITARQKVRNEKAREATTVDRRKKVQDKLDDVEAMRNKTVNVSLRVKLIQAGLKISERQYYIYSIVFAILVGVGAYMGAGLNMYACIGLTIIAGIGLPKWFVGHLARSRQAKFIAEFANTLDVMVRGVKTGLPLVETLEIVANESPEPIRSEFNEVVEQQRVGITLAEALDRMHAR
ncbi:MAG: type II secretion system F family protein, partial [Pseudomonadota bacterium]